MSSGLFRGFLEIKRAKFVHVVLDNVRVSISTGAKITGVNGHGIAVVLQRSIGHC